MRVLEGCFAKFMRGIGCALGAAGNGSAKPSKYGRRKFREDGPLQVAKIIEFYIPKRLRKNIKWIPPRSRGRIIEFTLPAKKSA
jgi:hypothetical protein